MPENKIKKVLLVNPTNTMLADSIRRIGEPLGILYIGAVLRNHGFEVRVFDMACEGYDNCYVKDGYVTYGSSPDELKKRILSERPDLVGVNCMFTSREANTLAACSAVKEADANIPVAVGGLHPSLFPERFLESGFVDYVIIGEGEFRTLSLLRSLQEDDNATEFDGIAFRHNGKCCIRPMSSRIENLDSVPFPCRDLIDMEAYIKIGAPFAPFSYKERVAQILATRGCPNSCNFCSSVNYWGKKIRARSVDNIIQEMRLLKEKYNIEEIQFTDDNLTFNKKFAKELFIKMKELGFYWCTPNGLMLNTMDAEMIKLMAECGAYQLTFAIESGSERVLKEIIHKNVNLKIVRSLVEEAHKYDISVHGMFVLGFPGEKRGEIMQTLDFPFWARFDSVSFFIANPIPGSELYDWCQKNNYLAKNYSTMDFKTVNIHIPRDSMYYNIEPQELMELIKGRTHQFNEWAKKEFPERWQRKFKRYLSSHPQDNQIIMGRVT